MSAVVAETPTGLAPVKARVSLQRRLWLTEGFFRMRIDCGVTCGAAARQGWGT